jgi:hypothetical protein cdiviTM7_02984
VPSILKKALKLVFADDGSTGLVAALKKKNRPLKKFTERELIQLESEIGATIFGEKPAHVTRREFFNLDKDTWIWYEEIVDKDGKKQELTTRYEVQPKGILKVQPNYRYSYLEGDELQNFVLAVKEYYERVSRDLYKRDPQTGYRL